MEGENDEPLSILKSTSTSKLYNLLSRLFYVLRRLDIKHNHQIVSRGTKLVIGSIVQATQTAQIISLEASLNTTPFIFWEVLAYSRVDWWAHKLGLLPQFVMICYIYIITILSLISVAVWFKKSKGRIFDNAILGIRLLLSSVFDVLLIPSLVVLVATIKYADEGLTTLTEYENSPASDLKTSKLFASFSAICFVLLFGIEVMRLLAFGNVHLISTGLKYNSRSSYRFEVLVRVGLSALAVLFFISSQFSSAIFRSSVAVIGLGLAYRLYYSLPYYENKINSMKFVSYVLLSWTAISFEVQNLVGVSATGFVLILFIFPCLIYSTIGMCPARLARLQVQANERIWVTRCLIEFEQCLRLKMTSASTKENLNEIQLIFNKFRRRCPDVDKMFDIYEVCFCIDMLGDRKLACVKLGNMLRPGFSLEAGFYEFCLRSQVNKKSYKSDEYKFLEYSLVLDKVKRLDQRVTTASYHIWNEFSIEKLSIDKLINCLGEIDTLSDKIIQKYEYLMRIYPDSAYVCQIYSSFLCVVMRNRDASRVISLKKMKLSSVKRRILQDFSYFDEFNGIMIIETDPQNFAKISYANERAASIFEIPLELLIGSDLNNFIPPPYNRNHRKAMEHFVANCRHTTIELPFNLFVYTRFGFLKDCSLVAKITAVNSFPIFLVVLIDRPVTKEIALLDCDGKIQCHTIGLPAHLGSDLEKLEGLDITELVPVKFKELKEFKAFSIRLGPRKIRMAYAVTMVNKIAMRLLFFFTTIEEYSYWKRGSNQNAIQELKRFYTLDEHKTHILAEDGLLSPRRRVYINADSSETIPVYNIFSNEETSMIASQINIRNLHLKPKNSIKLSKKTNQTSELNDHFHSALKLSQLSMISFELLVVIGILGLMLYVVVVFNYAKSSELMTVLGDIPFNVLYMGLNARFLNYAKMGIELVPLHKIHSNMNDTINSLTSHLSYIENLEPYIKAKGFSSLYENNYIREWMLINGFPLLSQKNFFDFLKDFSASGSQLVNQSVEDADFVDKDFYFLYRNGLAESFVTLNSTMELCTDKVINSIEVIDDNLRFFISVVVCLIALGFSVAAVSILWLQRYFEKLWLNFTSYKPNQVEDLKVELYNRLLDCFGEEAVFNIKQNTIPNKVLRTQGKTTKMCANIWKISFLKLTTLLIVAALLILVFYFVSFQNLKTTVQVYSQRNRIAQQIRLDILFMTAWTVEISLHNVTDAANPLTPYYPDFKNTFIKISKDTASQIHEINNPIINISFKNSSILYESAGLTDDPYFNQGLRGAVGMLINELEYCSEYCSVDELKDLLIHCNHFSDIINVVIENMREASNLQQQSRITEIQIDIVIAAISTVLMSIFVIKGMYNSFTVKVEQFNRFLVIE